MEQHEIIEGLREERERLMEYLSGLPDGAWDRASLCPGWRVRDVVAHLIGNCADVLDQNLDGVGSDAYNQRQVDERLGRSPAELLAEWAQAGPGCEAVYEAMPPDLWRMEMPGIIGWIGGGVLRQLEDLWVHAQDVRIGLGGEPSAGTGVRAALEVAAADVEPLLRKHASEIGAIELRLPDFERTIPGDGDRTVHITGDPVAFALVATGRWTVDAAQEDGRLRMDPELPNAGRVLQIYGPEFSERV